MEKLEQRIRQLEIELVGEKFKSALLMDKLGVKLEDIKAYAKACLNEFPESERNTDMYDYLTGLVKGEGLKDGAVESE